MLKLSEIYIQDDVVEILKEKTKIYNQKHPEDPITIQVLAETCLDYGIRYLDISALD